MHNNTRGHKTDYMASETLSSLGVNVKHKFFNIDLTVCRRYNFLASFLCHFNLSKNLFSLGKKSKSTRLVFLLVLKSGCLSI